MDADRWTVKSECILTMGSSSRTKRKTGFEWNATSSVPEDLDTLQGEESVNSVTIHGASYILSVIRANFRKILEVNHLYG